MVLCILSSTQSPPEGGLEGAAGVGEEYEAGAGCRGGVDGCPVLQLTIISRSLSSYLHRGTGSRRAGGTLLLLSRCCRHGPPTCLGCWLPRWQRTGGGTPSSWTCSHWRPCHTSETLTQLLCWKLLCKVNLLHNVSPFKYNHGTLILNAVFAVTDKIKMSVVGKSLDFTRWSNEADRFKMSSWIYPSLITKLPLYIIQFFDSH